MMMSPEATLISQMIEERIGPLQDEIEELKKEIIKSNKNMIKEENEIMIPSQKIISFEQNYPDSSGVEFAIRYYSETESYGKEIELERIDKINFPISEIDWMIKCLKEIKKESM